MWPTLIQIGPFAIHTYGLMIATGFLVALYFLLRDFGRHGVDTQIISNMAFWVLILGIAGSRLLHILSYPELYSWSHPLEWIAIWHGGLVFQGALPLPVLYVWWATRKYKLNFWLVTDIALSYVPLAHAFGRMGCFFNGCCYGKISHLPWAMSFPRVPWNTAEPPVGSPPYLDHIQRFSQLSPSVDHWSYPVHPTQLYSAIMLLALFCTLLLMRKYWKPFTGFVLPVYLMLYGIGRFLIEFLRGDNKIAIAGLTEQQVYCLAGIVAGFLLYLYLSKRRRKRAANKAA